MAFVEKLPVPVSLLIFLISVCSLTPFLPWSASDDLFSQATDNTSVTVAGVVIDQQTGKPVAGTKVTLGLGPLSTREEEPLVSTLTDEQGRFQFKGLDPGPYILIASRQGYARSPLRVVELEPRKAITLEVSLERLNKYSGTVVDESNSAIEGARIWLVGDSDQTPASNVSPLATSAHDGKFEVFAPANVGNLTLVTLARNYAPHRLPLPQKSSGILVRLSRGLSVSGRVIDEHGTPISKAAITIQNRETPAEISQLGNEKLGTTTGSDGRFILRGLEPKTYSLNASHPGHASLRIPNVKIRSQSTNSLPDIVLLLAAELKGRVADSKGEPLKDVTISAVNSDTDAIESVSNENGEFSLNGFSSGTSVVISASAPGFSKTNQVVRVPVDDVSLVLSRNGVLKGRVQDATTLAPVTTFQVHAGFGLVQKSFRSEDGTFEWNDLPPGQWNFSVAAPGYRKTEITGVEIPAGEITNVITFALSKGEKLAGRVVDDATSKGIPNVVLNYQPLSEPESPARQFYSRTAGGQKTDSDGNFNLDGLPSEKITIVARSSGYAESRRIVAAGDERFVEIRLLKGASVSGRVVGFDGNIATKAKVSLSDANASTTTISVDNTGAFTFSGLASGLYRLTADTSLGSAKPREIALADSEQIKDLLLTVQPGVTLRGKVNGLRPDESPIVDIFVRQGSDFEQAASTLPDGTFTIPGIPNGRAELLAQTARRVLTKSLEVPKGAAELRLDIDFPNQARLSGRVTRDGKAVISATVSAIPRNQELVTGSGKTDQNGMYSIDGLNEGDYMITVGRERARAVRITGDTLVDIALDKKQ